MVGLCLAQGPGAACAVRGKKGVRLRGTHALRNGARALAARLAACGMVLSLMAGLAQAQLKLNIPGGGNPFGDAADKAQEDLFTKAAAKLLDEQLPINLDASHVLPTVSALPGGPFAPRPLPLTQANMTEPLPPGDYTVNVFAFCTEYSVHQPGQGVAYELAPLEGKLSGAVATLLWRGIRAGVDSRALMGAAWAIQSGLIYAQMPKGDQALIDRLIPDFKPQLDGDFLLQLEASYQLAARAAKLPTLPQLLAKMGEPGELALDALAMQQTLLRANTTDEIREQTLFAGQESGVYAPVKAEEGPWTVRIPGVAYVRYRIQGGNLASNNIVEIRIMPGARQNAARQEGRGDGARLVNASFVASPAPAAGQTQAAAPTLENLLGADESNGQLNASGLIGYSVGRGAQALIPVLPPPVSAPPPQPATPKIRLAGKDVTGLTQSIEIGQLVSLSVDANGLNVQKQEWQIPGTMVKNFIASTSQGTVTPLTDTAETSVDYYWVDSNPSRTVTLTYQLADESPGSVETTFDVQGPTQVNVSTSMGSVTVGSLKWTPARIDKVSLFLGNLSSNPLVIQRFIPGYDDYELGIKNTADVSVPDNVNGTLSWVQLISYNQTVEGAHAVSQTTQSALDTGYPYPSTNGGLLQIDAPGIPLADGNTLVTSSENFSTYLMWTPKLDSSMSVIPVPLGVVTWQWSGAAKYDPEGKKWALQDQPEPTQSFTQFKPGTDFPQWTHSQVGTPKK